MGALAFDSGGGSIGIPKSNSKVVYVRGQAFVQDTNGKLIIPELQKGSSGQVMAKKQADAQTKAVVTGIQNNIVKPITNATNATIGAVGGAVNNMKNAIVLIVVGLVAILLIKR